MVEVKPRDIRCHIHVNAIIHGAIMNVGDDDGISRTSHISLPTLPCPTCSTALLCLALVCLSFSIIFREIMHNKSFWVYPASHEERPIKTLEPTRSTLPNTFQNHASPTHSEYHYINLASSEQWTCRPRACTTFSLVVLFSPEGKLLSTCIALLYTFSRVLSDSFAFFGFSSFRLLTFFLSLSSELWLSFRLFLSVNQWPLRASALCGSAATTALRQQLFDTLSPRTLSSWDTTNHDNRTKTFSPIFASVPYLFTPLSSRRLKHYSSINSCLWQQQ